MLGRKQQHQVVRSFPNRYLFSLTNKVTSLFPISCILEIILWCKIGSFDNIIWIRRIDVQAFLLVFSIFKIAIALFLFENRIEYLPL